MLNELSPDDVKNMDIVSLVQRMDEVRIHAEEERYGIGSINWHIQPFPLVSQIMVTKATTSMNDIQKRKLADCAFRYLLQMDLISVSGGISNREVYDPNYHENCWNPLFTG